MEDKKLSNGKVYIQLVEGSSEGDYIIASDVTDQNNDPKIYTRAKRGVLKAWQELENSKMVENGASFHEVWDFLETKHLDLHFYCAVD